MRHLAVDQWSRGSSYLHRTDPRAKLVALVVFLAALGTSRIGPLLGRFAAGMAIYYVLLLMAVAAARLPVAALSLRATAVLPFAATLSMVTWLAGDHDRAVLLIVKTYLSALSVVLLISTTPAPLLLSGMESLGAPRVLVMIVQFLYRYLFVITDQAQRMRQAAACRQGTGGSRRPNRFSAAAGALSVLFARSYERAEGIHRAMLSRAFSGKLTTPGQLAWHVSDLIFLAGSVLTVLAVRLAFPIA